jgi:2-(1,2-epoxy-1,2-dihydrophenyl)acetyl-CoA isomerase
MAQRYTFRLVKLQPARQYETLLLHRTDAAATIVLNRPDRMNAWSEALSRDLLDALNEVAADPGVRAVMLTGSGRAFCAGADLKEVAADPGVPPRLDEILTTWYNPTVTLIREMPKPVIAAVNGAAAGAGVGLALAADLVVARQSAYFLLAFVNIGLVPDGGSSFFIPERVGFARAAELALLGERLASPRAAEIGLINAAYPDDEFDQHAAALLLRLSGGPTRSYAGTKRELNRWMNTRLADHLVFEATLQRDLGASRDFAEGVTAFLDKRPAAFTGE